MIKTEALIGFSLAINLSETESAQWDSIHNLILSKFHWLKIVKIKHGATNVCAWMHRDVNSPFYVSPNNELMMIVGSPFEDTIYIDQAYEDIQKRGDEYTIPWEGRCSLVLINQNGSIWEIWTDWLSTVPIYYGESNGRIASTLEPVVVKSLSLNNSNISKRGLVELLSFGQFIGNDTLYESVKTLEADSYNQWLSGHLGKTKYLATVEATEINFETNRGKLIDQLHDHTIDAIKKSLQPIENSVNLPLSGGMDSRLIACVASELGVPVNSYTYGPKEWTEVYFARMVAECLNLPWKQIDLGLNYSSDYINEWLAWFGSSLHAHGMYQFPFLYDIAGSLNIIPNGFIGNNMAGGDHPNICLFDRTKKNFFDRFLGYGLYWDSSSLEELLGFNLEPYKEEIEQIFQSQLIKVVDWPNYQKMNIVDLWNRQKRFIYYQPEMYNYFGKERSPFMQRDYARFCMSLPDTFLWKRNLQIEMLEKYWPAMGRIGSTFTQRKGIDRKWHGLRQTIAEHLPKEIRPLVGITSVNLMSIDCIRQRGMDVFFPISNRIDLIDVINTKVVGRIVQSALKGSKRDYMKIVAIQPIIYRLLNN
jgi:hypothetical protein